MLKIAIDGTSLTSQPSGIGLYAKNLIYALYNLQDQDNFLMSVVYQPRLKEWLRFKANAPKFLNLDTKIYKLPIPVTISSFLSRFPNPIIPYFESAFGFPDILHGLDHVVYPCSKSLKVMTIHDLTFIKYPNFASSITKNYSERVKHCISWTDLIITVSESSKRDIVKYLDVKPQKIYVTPLASRYRNNYLKDEVIDILKENIGYDFTKPYILFVGTFEPRKNINNIIYAFNLLKKKYKIDHQLVLIGKKGWKYESILKDIQSSSYTNEIFHLDYLADELVAIFYSRADVFVYPSHYEGFGLPILEAMTLGTPVITSDNSSIPEVTGNAAILINPNDFMQIAEAILKVISDRQLKENLISRGKAQANLFSWDNTAKETLKAYKSII
ncbi:MULTISPECIES: glycosyltransferase family 4 protein [Pseudanabaena]|uniref:Glycosyl transferase group 1 n=2 Tax=Pseudanabaena TaxID=1152 RepID=L8MYH0_9CYAN|nr:MULTISPECIES: glycosyltransferase family 1 protein [Pseudanabaena]ELS33057.1 glycosyl transferase group 1 [Pseudanabaena biceps PCC 7429]MDG3494707.1 glycosyltransferase family 1 protein [Pseudanabaena catenata USMAC16]